MTDSKKRFLMLCMFKLGLLSPRLVKLVINTYKIYPLPQVGTSFNISMEACWKLYKSLHNLILLPCNKMQLPPYISQHFNNFSIHIHIILNLHHKVVLHVLVSATIWWQNGRLGLVGEHNVMVYTHCSFPYQSWMQCFASSSLCYDLSSLLGNTEIHIIWLECTPLYKFQLKSQTSYMQFTCIWCQFQTSGQNPFINPPFSGTAFGDFYTSTGFLLSYNIFWQRQVSAFIAAIPGKINESTLAQIRTLTHYHQVTKHLNIPCPIVEVQPYEVTLIPKTWAKTSQLLPTLT